MGLYLLMDRTLKNIGKQSSLGSSLEHVKGFYHWVAVQKRDFSFATLRDPPGAVALASRESWIAIGSRRRC